MFIFPFECAQQPDYLLNYFGCQQTAICNQGMFSHVMTTDSWSQSGYAFQFVCVAITTITAHACLHHYEVCLYINSLVCSTTQYTTFSLTRSLEHMNHLRYSRTQICTRRETYWPPVVSYKALLRFGFAVNQATFFMITWSFLANHRIMQQCEYRHILATMLH